MAGGSGVEGRIPLGHAAVGTAQFASHKMSKVITNRKWLLFLLFAPLVVLLLCIIRKLTMKFSSYCCYQLENSKKKENRQRARTKFDFECQLRI